MQRVTLIPLQSVQQIAGAISQLDNEGHLTDRVRRARQHGIEARMAASTRFSMPSSIDLRRDEAAGRLLDRHVHGEIVLRGRDQ
jgi:hypothetical protein